MKCAVLTYGEPCGSFHAIPRGTYAYIHYLQQFGHEVIHEDRPACRRPFRLLQRLRQWQPDVVLGQHAGAMLAAFWRRIGVLRCPVVHAWDDYYSEQSRLPNWVVWPMEKASVTGSDHVTSVSRYNVGLARQWGIAATFIPHGVTPDQRPSSMVIGSARFKVIYLGDQSLYKGMHRLMAAMEAMDADLFMVGTTNPELQRIAPPNVQFVGKVLPQEVQAVLRQADVLVNPSDQDSNFKLQEYVRAGKPILGVTGRMACAFEHGKDAWLADDLRAGLIRLKEDAVLRARLEAGLRQRSIMTWEEVGRALESVLLAVVREKAACPVR